MKDKHVIDLHETLQRIHFYGLIIETWQDGKVVMIRKEETFLPEDYNRFNDNRVSRT